MLLNLLSIQDRNFDRQPILQIEKDTIKIYNDDLSIKSLRIIKNPKQIPFEKFEFNQIARFPVSSGPAFEIWPGAGVWRRSACSTWPFRGQRLGMARHWRSVRVVLGTVG